MKKQGLIVLLASLMMLSCLSLFADSPKSSKISVERETLQTLAVKAQQGELCCEALKREEVRNSSQGDSLRVEKATNVRLLGENEKLRQRRSFWRAFALLLLGIVGWGAYQKLKGVLL